MSDPASTGGGAPLHFTCGLDGVHLAIHPAEGWAAVATQNVQSPVLALRTTHARALADRLATAGVSATGPLDHGFAQVVTFRDPDGNHSEILEPTS